MFHGTAMVKTGRMADHVDPGLKFNPHRHGWQNLFMCDTHLHTLNLDSTQSLKADKTVKPLHKWGWPVRI